MSNILVKLINISDVRERAWKISRPYLKEFEAVDMESLDKTDFSLQMLKQVTFSFKTSAFFRELLTTIRPYGMWSQSSRVNSIDSIEFPYYLSPLTKEECSTKLSEAKSMMLSSNDKSIQDLARLHLPIGHISEYVFQTDIRTMICFLKSLRKIKPFYYKIYGKLIEEELNISNIDEYRFPLMFEDNWSVDDSNLLVGSSSIGNFIAVKDNISISLRAQLARHTGISIRDNFFWSNNLDEELESYALKDEISVVLYTDKNTWSKVLNHRACWIAQYELGYDKYIKSYLELNPSMSIKDMLPCKGLMDKCSCSNDVKARVSGEDPGIPCPIWTKSKVEIDRRLSVMGESFITESYQSLI